MVRHQACSWNFCVSAQPMSHRVCPPAQHTSGCAHHTHHIPRSSSPRRENQGQIAGKTNPNKNNQKKGGLCRRSLLLSSIILVVPNSVCFLSRTTLDFSPKTQPCRFLCFLFPACHIHHSAAPALARLRLSDGRGKLDTTGMLFSVPSILHVLFLRPLRLANWAACEVRMKQLRSRPSIFLGWLPDLMMMHLSWNLGLAGGWVGGFPCCDSRAQTDGRDPFGCFPSIHARMAELCWFRLPPGPGLSSLLSPGAGG